MLKATRAEQAWSPALAHAGNAPSALQGGALTPRGPPGHSFVTSLGVKRKVLHALLILCAFPKNKNIPRLKRPHLL